MGAVRRAIARVATSEIINIISVSQSHLTHETIKTNLLLSSGLATIKINRYCCSLILQIFFNEFNDVFPLVPACVALCGESGDGCCILFRERGMCQYEA